VSTVCVGGCNWPRSQVRKIDKIRVINRDLERREFAVPLFLCNPVTHMLMFCFPVKRQGLFFFRPVRKIAKSYYQLLHVCPPVRVGKLGFHWTDFHEI